MLAGFGVVCCGVLAVLLLRTDLDVLGWVFVALAMIAAVDLAVVYLRWRARRSADRDHHTLFE